MGEEDNACMRYAGKTLGFLAGYLLFTTVLFFVLRTLEKLPAQRSFFHVMALTLAVTAAGLVVKRVVG